MRFQFDQVYVEASGCVGTAKEAEGLKSGTLDFVFQSDLCGETTFEKAERALLRKACDVTLRKAKLTLQDIDVLAGADLNNQLSASHYFARELHIPFIGMYAACASSSLLLTEAGLLLSQSDMERVMIFTSSHYASASKQFRFPNTYGEQKKESATTTVTGAGCMILSHQPSAISLSEGIIGTIFDWDYQNVSDMGVAMAPAVYQTLRDYLKESHQTPQDFDCIASGDLSRLGFDFLCELMREDGYQVDERFTDCGLMIYDCENQDVFCGGSGPACSMVVAIADLFEKLRQGVYQRILLLSSGALFSPVAIQQKESIPCICHGAVFERRNV